MSRLLRAAAVAASTAVLVLAVAPGASALPNPFCDPQAPMIDMPDEGTPGTFLERPGTIVPSYDEEVADPENIFATGGLGGMDEITYDLGCDVNPANWNDSVSASTDRTFSTMFVDGGHTVTAAADAIDRRAWQPDWIVTFLSNFAGRVADVATARVLVPLVALGLILTSVVLAWRGRNGNVPRVLSGVIWVFVVLLIGIFVLSGPVRTATTTQSAGGGLVSALHGGGDPAIAATESVTTAVHYNGFLRRLIGNESGDTAERYGPALLANTRMTWDEYQRTDPSLAGDDDEERDRRLEARKELIEAKQDRFNDIAAKIKDEDPQAYEHLRNTEPATGIAFVEASFALASSVFRIAADLLMILCLVLLTVYAVIFVIAIPAVVTPWGEDLGKGLLNGAARAVGYVIVAAVASWLWSAYAEAALQPGYAAWWSFVWLLIGTFAFWTMTRPDRKALNLLTMGRVRGNGRLTRRLIGRLTSAVVAGKVAGKVQARAMREEMREDEEERDRRYGYDERHHKYAADREGGRTPRYDGPDGSDEYQEPDPSHYQRDDGRWVGEPYDPLDRDGRQRAHEERRRTHADDGWAPEPPPAGAEGEEEVYQREEDRSDYGDRPWWRR